MENSEEIKILWKKYRKPLQILFKHYAEMEDYKLEELTGDFKEIPLQYKSFVKMCCHVCENKLSYIVGHQSRANNC